MKRYVVGFLFDDLTNVLLIRKNRPEWQVGYLNGVGGHIEDESELEAMIREAKEEIGVEIKDWKSLAVVRGDDWIVYFYYAINPQAFDLAFQTTDEPIERICAADVGSYPVISNLIYLIPMALDEYLVKPVIMSEVTR